MSSPRRPKTLVLLLLFFCWVDAKSLGAIVFPSTSGSYHFYVAQGLPWLHYVSSAVTVAFAATATGYLWKPRDGWFEASTTALALLALSALGGVWYTLRHVDVARESYAAGRAERGLPVAPERLAELFTAEVLWTGALVMMVWLALLALLAWRQREYLPPDIGGESPAD